MFEQLKSSVINERVVEEISSRQRIHNVLVDVLELNNLIVERNQMELL